MSFFGMLFWIAVLWLVIRWWRSSERCAAGGASGYSAWDYGRGQPETRGSERTRTDTQQEYIESLESRLSELEERLDFTERLLASRGEEAGKSGSRMASA